MDQQSKESQAEGSIGETYAGPTGNCLAEETEYTIGWYQSSEKLRVKVIYTRVSHTKCQWEKIQK